MLRIDRDGLLKLRHRLSALTALLVQEPEVVVNLGAGAALLEQRPVVRDRIVEIANALIVEREVEMIVGLRRRHPGGDAGG